MKEAPCSCLVSTYSIEDFDNASISRIFSSPGIPKTWVTPSFSRHSTISSAVERDCSCMTPSLVACLFGSAAASRRLRPYGRGVRMEVMTADDDVAAKQISELEAKRYQAMTDGDIGTLAGLFSSNLVYTHSDASSDSKQSYLDRLASGHFDYGVIEHPETSVVVHGDCAIVVGDMRGEVRIGGQTRVLNSRSLAVWVRENGNWVLLAYQPTKYPSSSRR